MKRALRSLSFRTFLTAKSTSQHRAIDTALSSVRGFIQRYTCLHRASFDLAAAYLGGFGVRFALVTGNHDLEGAEFRTDEGNLAAWHQVIPLLKFCVKILAVCAANCQGVVLCPKPHPGQHLTKSQGLLFSKRRLSVPPSASSFGQLAGQR